MFSMTKSDIAAVKSSCEMLVCLCVCVCVCVCFDLVYSAVRLVFCCCFLYAERRSL